MALDVSIIIAVKNEQLHIRESLNSVLNQDGDFSFEVVVVDDFSDDNTLEIISGIAKADPRVKYYRNVVPGKVNAFNFAYSQSSGHNVCFFSGDDIMLPHGVFSRLKAICKSDELTSAIVLSKQRTISEVRRYDGHIIPRAPGAGGWNGTCIMLNKKLANIVFPIPASLPNEDTWTQAVASHCGANVIHNSEIVCLYRIHDNNTMSKTLSFPDYSYKLNRRYYAYSLVEGRLRARGVTLQNANRLRSIIKLENARYDGDLIKVFTIKGICFKDRLRAFVYSSSSLYNIRQRLFGLFSGF